MWAWCASAEISFTMAAVERLEPVGIENDNSAKHQQLVVSSWVDTSAYSSKIPSVNFTVSDNQLSSGVSSDDLTQYPFSLSDGSCNIRSPQTADSPKAGTARLSELLHVECMASESSNVGENLGEFADAMVVMPGTKGAVTKSLSCERADFSQGVSYTSQRGLCLAQSTSDASGAMCSVQEPCYSIANSSSSTASAGKSALEADARSFTRSETPSSTGSSPPPLAMYSKRPNTVLEVFSGTPDTRLPPTSSSRDSLIVGFATTCTSVGIGFDDAISNIGDTSLIQQNKPPLVASTPFIERSMDHHPLSGPQADEHLSDSGRASSSSVDLACRAGDLELMRIFYGGQEIADFISNEKDAECDALSLNDLALPGVMKIKTDQVSADVDQYNDSTDRSANSLTFYEDSNINSASDRRAVNANETPKSSVHSYSSEDKERVRQQCTSLSAVGSEESSTVLHAGSGPLLDVLSDSTGPGGVSGNSLRSEDGKGKVAYTSGLTTNSLPFREPNSSENGSEYDDDLGEDVRRILAKYRVSYLSKSGSDHEQNTASSADSSRSLVEVHPLTSESLVNMAVSEPSHSIEKEVDTASQTSNDTLALRVRGLLARDLSKNADGDVVITGNENCSYPLSSASVSSSSSSRTVSVDYGSLCKDLDDIQAGLENLRTSEKASLSSRHSSFSSISSISGFNPKNVTAVHKFSYNDAAPTPVYGEFAVAADSRGAVQMNESNENCVNPLLTSGVLPIDVALDLLHGPVTTTATNDISNSDGFSFADTQTFFEKDVTAGRQGIELRSHDNVWNNPLKVSRDTGTTTHDVPCSLAGQALKDTSSVMFSDKAKVVDKSLSSQNSFGLPASNSSSHLSGHENVTLSTSVRPGHCATSGGELAGGEEAGRTSGLRPAMPLTLQSSCYLPMASPSRQSDAGWSSGGRRDTSMVEDVLQDSHEPLPNLYQRPAGNSGAVALSEHDSRYQADASLSEYSFSEQVQDAFERGSPPRQAYEYLREAEELKQALDFADRKPGASLCDDEFCILSQDVDMTGSFGLSPLPQHSPFDVMKTVRPLFMSQLDRISTADFNSSIGSSTKVSSVSPHQVDYNREQAGLAHCQLSTAKQYQKSVPTDTSFSTVSGSGGQTGFLNEYNRFMPLTPLQADVSENSFVDADDVSEAEGHTSNSSSRIALPVGDELFSHTVATSGGRSLRSDSPASILLPYQPGGSHEIYYVDSSAEEMSVARSETTVESTHPGSDDAKAPVFPAHVYGSRAEAPVGATGIYSKRKSPLVSNELSAIEERTSSASDTKDGHGLASHSRHSLSSKSDSEKSRRMDKEQSVLKTKAWISDINASHETKLQPDMKNFVGQRSSAILTDPAAVPGPLSGLTVNGLPTSRMPGSSHSDTIVTQQQAASRTGLSNEASHLVASLPNFHLKPGYGTTVPSTRSFAMRNLSFDDASEDSFSSGSRANETRIANKMSSVPQNFQTDDKDFCTPVKTADSLSAAARHRVNVGSENRGKVASALFPQTVTTEPAAALPHEERQGTGFVADDRFGVRFESHYGLMPGVQTLIDRYVEKSQLQDSSSARSKQYATPDSGTVLQTDQHFDDESTDRADVRNAASENIHTHSSALESVLLIPPPAGFDESITASNNGSGASHLQKLWERFTLTRPADTDIHDGSMPVVQPVRQPNSSRNLDLHRTAVNSADETQQKEPAGSNSRPDENTQNSTERTHSSSQRAVNWSSSRGLSSANWHNSSSDSDQSPTDWQDKNRTEHRVFRERTEKTEAQKTQKATSSSKNTDSKRAWVIKEETLAPVPEDMTLDSVTSDFTSTSSVDNSGNIVTHTTKRHLPNDPRLLRLHQKIAIQREKHKKVQANERRRKERITELERRLENEEALLRARNQRTAAGNAEETNATLLASTDVTATTLTGSTNISSTLTNDESDSTVQDPSNDTAQEDGFDSLVDRDASVCCACHRYASRHASPPPVTTTTTTATAAAAASPVKRRAARSEVVISPKLHLQEVSYTRGRGAKPLHGYSSSNLQYEHRRASKSCHVRTKVAASAAPSKKHEMFQYETENTAPRDWLDHRRSGKKLVVSKDGNGSLSVRHSNCRTRGDVEREEPRIVSTAVQTTPRLHDTSVGIDSALVNSDVTLTGRTAGQRTVVSRAFQPEFSSSRTEQEIDQQMVIKKRPPTIQQRSLAWFVPFSGDETFDGPLKEIQQHLNIMQNSLSEWRSRGSRKDRVTSDSEVLDTQNLKESDRPRVNDNDSGLPRPSYGSVRQVLSVMPVSLQEAFDSNMAEFMSRSRERQRFVFLRAEERRLQDLEADERERLFGFNNQQISNTVADPAVDKLFHPRRRYFSKLEMKDLTKRNYGKLPEVARAMEMKQKIELVRSNWIRRKQYAQFISDRSDGDNFSPSGRHEKFLDLFDSC